MTLVEIFCALPPDVSAALEKRLDTMPVSANPTVDEVKHQAELVVAQVKLDARALKHVDITLFKVLDCAPEAILEYLFGPNWYK